MACGARHTGGVNRAGDLVSWGRGDSGRLGHGNNHDDKNPRTIEKVCFFRVMKHIIRYFIAKNEYGIWTKISLSYLSI